MDVGLIGLRWKMGIVVVLVVAVVVVVVVVGEEKRSDGLWEKRRDMVVCVFGWWFKFNPWFFKDVNMLLFPY
ncbi:hypothetical protein Hanom_Chr00s000001g01594651 [Helianthus anomalus]